MIDIVQDFNESFIKHTWRGRKIDELTQIISEYQKYKRWIGKINNINQ